jgi:hypothetical protein
MRSPKSNWSSEIERSLENGIEGNVRNLTRTSGVFHQNGNGEMSGDNLGTLLRRVSEASTREIGSLIDELHGLRKKLEAQGERIQSDIVGHTELSRAVMELTTIISDSMKRLPSGKPNADP